MYIDINFKFTLSTSQASSENFPHRLYLSVLKADGIVENIRRKTFTIIGSDPEFQEGFAKLLKIKINETVPIKLAPGDEVSFSIAADGENLQSNFRIIEAQTSSFKVYYHTKGNPMKDVDVIDPQKLGQALLNKMAGSNVFKLSIEWPEVDYKVMLCAGESIRGYKKAILHTSYRDFWEWIKCFGLEQDYNIDTKELKFVHRDRYFEPDKTALELTPKDFSDIRKIGTNDYSYTSVKIGYKKQNYDSTNGRFEPAGTFEYNTGFVSITEHTLSFISLYRADAVGIELLFWERENETADNKSDKDVFVIAMHENTDHYVVYEGIQTNINKDVRLFNTPLLPPFMVKMNESCIGIATDQ